MFHVGAGVSTMIPARKAPGLAAAALSLALGCTGQIAGEKSGAGPAGTESGGPGPNGSSGPNGSAGPNGGTGSSAGPGGTTTPAATPGPDGIIDSAGPYPLRRLTRSSTRTPSATCWGSPSADDDRRGFSTDQVLQGGFGSGAAIATSTDSRQFLDVSAKVAAAATADLAKLMPAGCAAPAAGRRGGLRRPSSSRPWACALSGARSSAGESSGLVGLYTKLRSAARERAVQRGRARRAAGHPAGAGISLPLGAGRRADQGRRSDQVRPLRDCLAPVVLPVGVDAGRRRCLPPPSPAGSTGPRTSPRRPRAC